MTYEGRSTGATNRILMTLVIITIVLVAYWAVTGGLDQIPLNQVEGPTVSE